MQIALGTLIYFVLDLALGVVTGKLLRYRRRGQPAMHAALFVRRPFALVVHLAAAER